MLGKRKKMSTLRKSGRFDILTQHFVLGYHISCLQHVLGTNPIRQILIVCTAIAKWKTSKPFLCLQ